METSCRKNINVADAFQTLIEITNIEAKKEKKTKNNKKNKKIDKNNENNEIKREPSRITITKENNNRNTYKKKKICFN